MDDQAASPPGASSSSSANGTDFDFDKQAGSVPAQEVGIAAAVEKEDHVEEHLERSSLVRGSTSTCTAGSSNARSSARATSTTTNSTNNNSNNSNSSSSMDKSEPGTVARVEGEGHAKYQQMKRQSASAVPSTTASTSSSSTAPSKEAAMDASQTSLTSSRRRATVTAVGSSIIHGLPPSISRRSSSEPTAVILAQGGTMPFTATASSTSSTSSGIPPSPSPKKATQEETDAALKAGLKQSRAAARASVSQGSLPGLQPMPPSPMAKTTRQSSTTTTATNSNSGMMHSSAAEADARIKAGLRNSRMSTYSQVGASFVPTPVALAGNTNTPTSRSSMISTTSSSILSDQSHTNTIVDAGARLKRGLRNSTLTASTVGTRTGITMMDDSSSNTQNTRRSRRNTTQNIPRASIMDADARQKHGLRNHSSATASTSPGVTHVSHRGSLMDDSSQNHQHTTSRASVTSRNSMIDADTRAKYGLRNPSIMDDGSHNSHQRPRGSVLSRGSLMDDGSSNSHRGSVVSRNSMASRNSSILEADARARSALSRGSPLDDASSSHSHRGSVLSRNSMMDADTRAKYGLRNSVAPGTPIRATHASSSPDRSVASSEGSALSDHDPSTRLFGDDEDKNDALTRASQADAMGIHISPGCATDSGNLRPGAYRGTVTATEFSLERAQSLQKGDMALIGVQRPLGVLQESYSNKEYEGELLEAAAMVVPQLAPQTTAHESQRAKNADGSSRRGTLQDDSAGASRKSIFWLKHFWWITLLIIVALIAISVGVVVGTSGSDSGDESGDSSESTTEQSSPQGLPIPLSTLFPTTVLANSTVNAIERGGGRAPQYLAYQWLVDDPALDAYSERQLLQRFALASLYYSTNGPNWFQEDADVTFLDYETHECSWFNTGVEQCAGYDRSEYLSDELRDHYDYVSLVLSGGDTRSEDIPQIRGELVPELSLLTSLKTVDIGLQELRGPIPAELSALSTLETLVLYGNYLSGVIPPSLFATPPKTLWLSHNDFGKQSFPSAIGSDLTSFYCINCNLEGTVPMELYQLTGLQELRLGQNGLTGTIMTSIGDLSRLETLLLSKNRLTGNLPSELGRLTALTDLKIQSNKIEGVLPIELGLLTSLWYFDVAGNKLGGTLIEELGMLSNLRELKLSKREELQALQNTGLSGEIPSSYLLRGGGSVNGTATTPAFPFLTHLWIEGTAVSGVVPTELALLAPLQGLRLGRNKFSGGRLPDLQKLSNLEELTFSFNDGLPERAIPSELGLLTKLTDLGLAGCNFHSSIPSELGLLSNLQYLKLQANTLTSEIPEEFMAVAETLDQLRINENSGNLSGTFPSGVCGIADLQLGCSENSKLCGCGCPCE